MYRIRKEFHFSAAHQLTHLPDGHPCARLHGHNYKVVIELESYKLDKNGFVVDYGDLNPLKEYIDDKLDHRNLNDVMEEYTTAENIAKHLYDLCAAWWPQTRRVFVSETPKTWASVSEQKANEAVYSA